MYFLLLHLNCRNWLESLAIEFALLFPSSTNFQVEGLVGSAVFLRYFARSAQDESTLVEKIDAAIEANRARFAQYKSLCEGTHDLCLILMHRAYLCILCQFALGN